MLRFDAADGSIGVVAWMMRNFERSDAAHASYAAAIERI